MAEPTAAIVRPRRDAAYLVLKHHQDHLVAAITYEAETARSAGAALKNGVRELVDEFSRLRPRLIGT